MNANEYLLEENDDPVVADDSVCGDAKNSDVCSSLQNDTSCHKQKSCDNMEVIQNGSVPTPKNNLDEVVESSENRHVDAEDNDSSESHELSPLKLKKLQTIVNALTISDSVDLQKIAVSEYGLLTDDLRRKIWPKLVGVDIYSTSPKPTIKEMEDHPYYRQVILDVNRSLKRFPPSIKEKQRLAMQDQLVFLIMRVLVKNPNLHYYQGYHDICVTFLLVLGEEMAFHVINKLSLSHLEIFMKKTMEPTTHMLHYMFPVIEKENPELFEFLEKSDVGIMFALSWLITWFGHVLNNYSDVVRLFDLFIASSRWLPVYLSASIVLYREKEIMKQECDMPCVHSLLSDIPDDLPFENLITDCLYLFEMYPPNSLDKTVAQRIKKKQDSLKVNRRRKPFLATITNIVYTVMPTSKFTISLAFAATVAVSAIVYQTYKSS